MKATLCDGEGSALRWRWQQNWNFFSNSFYLALHLISLLIFNESFTPSAP